MVKTLSKTSFSATVAKSETDRSTAAILILPSEVNDKLSSKGMNSAKVTLGDTTFVATLEPDGNGQHLLRINQKLLDETKVKIGDEIDVEIAPVGQEPEPKVPTDLQKALDGDSEASKLWLSITSLARRDWIHWVASARQAETRARRINQTKSKLKAGNKRPCCFNYQSPIFSYEPFKDNS